MATTYLLVDSVGTGIRHALLESDDLFVDAAATIASTDSIAVEATGQGNSISVKGTVAGDTGGLAVGDSPDDVDGHVRVFEGGLVTASSGAGIGFTGADHVLVNSGEVSSSDTAVSFTFSSRATVHSEGLISGRVGLSMSTAGAPAASMAIVVNHGTILATDAAYVGCDMADRIVNRGLIVGQVLLKDGDDTFDGRGGEIDGLVLGGAGNDRFLAGAGEDSFDGGLGASDTLDFRHSGGLRVSLRDDSGSGLAAGDTYQGIERVLGSRAGADQLVGDAADNVLVGFGGNDDLSGNGGADRLEGGEGVDRLRGGLGADTFVLNDINDAGDAILDFQGAASLADDHLEIRVAGFGGGLSAGVLATARFVTRADNAAQDANDRFVFRTTDRTLWFDPDGNGAGGPTLVADIQAGAVLTAADILLV